MQKIFAGILLLSALSTIGGCATSVTAPSENAATQVAENDYPTGSNIARRGSNKQNVVQMTAEQAEEMRRSIRTPGREQ